MAINTIILVELKFGILILPEGRRRIAFRNWFDGGVQRLRSLPWDTKIGQAYQQAFAI